jgi:hypothetical protein
MLKEAFLKAYIAAAKRLFKEEIVTREKTAIHELAVRFAITDDMVKQIWDKA